MKRMFLIFSIISIGISSCLYASSDLYNFVQHVTEESVRDHFYQSSDPSWDPLKFHQGKNREEGTTGHDSVKAYIEATLKTYLGNDNVYIDEFPWEDGTNGYGYNIIGVKEGRLGSNSDIWIVGAHYDSYDYDRTDSAPGANDNGSGMVGVLEMARVINTRASDATILFALWDAEEPRYSNHSWVSASSFGSSSYGGPSGSRAWVNDHLYVSEETGEPSNHISNLTVTDTISSGLTVTWDDNDGSLVADSFLVKLAEGSLPDDPVDGVKENLSGYVKKVPHGIRTATFTGLSPNTSYQIAVYPFSYYDSYYDYKVLPQAPSVSVTTPESGSSTITETLYQQSFEESASDNWNFVASPSPYYIGDPYHVWSRDSDLPSSPYHLLPLPDNSTYVWNGENTCAHSTDLHTLTFNPIDISSYAGDLTLHFNYQTLYYGSQTGSWTGTGDIIGYYVEYDNGSDWHDINLLNTGTNEWIEVVVDIPDTVDYVRLRFAVKNDEWQEIAAFDHIYILQEIGGPSQINTLELSKKASTESTVGTDFIWNHFKGNINLDMFGYPSVPNTLWLYHGGSEWNSSIDESSTLYPLGNDVNTLYEAATDYLETYGYDDQQPRNYISVVGKGYQGASDHISFSRAGIPSLEYAESNWSADEHYHKWSDYYRPESGDINFINDENPQISFMTMVIRGALALLADTAGVNLTADIPLPVELTDFNSISSDGYVSLKWETASETENLGFLIERRQSYDQPWSTICSYLDESSLIGQGNSTAFSEYTWLDRDVVVGERYEYRLSDIDFSGHVNPLRITSVTYQGDLEKMMADISENAYPNPFNPLVSINYTLPEKAMVSISIYDIEGRLVANLVENSLYEKGVHQTDWNAKNFPSGQYLIKISIVYSDHLKKTTVMKVLLAK